MTVVKDGLQGFYQNIVDKDKKIHKHLIGTMVIKAVHTHELVEVAGTEATCTTTGHSAYIKCKYCGDIFGEYPVIYPPTGHIEKIMIAGIAPTCTGTGMTSYIKCRTCGFEFTKPSIIPALNHKKTFNTTRIEPTCTLQGKPSEKKCALCGEILAVYCASCGCPVPKNKNCCENCGAVNYEQLEALGHNLVTVPAKEADFTYWEVRESDGVLVKKGWNTHKACTRCSYTEGKEEYTNKPKQHYGDYCHFSVRDRTQDTAATCTTAGKKNVYKCWHWSCHGCNSIKYTEIPKLGHNFVNKIRDEKYKRTNATCTAAATYYYGCTRCNESTKDYNGFYWVDSENMPNGEHKWKWENNTPLVSTCVHKAEGTLICENCGEKSNYYGSLDYSRHPTDSNGKLLSINENVNDNLKPTCTTPGYTFVHCAECDGRISADIYQDSRYVSVADPKTGKFYLAKENNEAALGHEYPEDSGYLKNSISCREMEAALGDIRVAFCKRCNKPADILLNRVEHDFDKWTLNVQNIIENDSTKPVRGHRHVCKNCGLIEFGKCDFDLSSPERIVQPTCLSAGYKEFKCKTCGIISKVYSEEEDGPIGHSWENYEILEDKHSRTCTRCGKVEVENHSKEKVSEGIERCKYCNALMSCMHINTVEIEKVEPTCTTEGLTSGIKCAEPECNVIIVPQKKINKLNHVYKILQDECIAATCTNTGLIVKECTLCGARIEEPTDALGHKSITIPGSDPGCLQEGWTPSQKCAVCGEILVEHESIPAYGVHLWNQAVNDTSCNLCKLKYCSRCGTQERVVSQLCAKHITADICEHIQKEAIATIKPTCTKNGHKGGIRCKICKSILEPYEKLDKLGHDFVAIDAKDATCFENGHTAGIQCTRCGLIKSGLEVIEARGEHGLIRYENCGNNRHRSFCSICGENLGESACGPYEISSDSHRCTVCNEEASHSYTTVSSNGCVSRIKRTYCSVCNQKKEDILTAGPGHKWQNATCTSPKRCTRCGRTSGAALGHSYNPATCKKPATCSRCGATSGSATSCKAYHYRCTKEPTCTSRAYGYYTCVYCGRVMKYAWTGNALGHNFVNNKCTRCGLQRVTYL